MRSIRAALDRLGYRPEVKYFQFVKQTPKGPVKIDLLTCDVAEEHADKVRIKPPRVRPIEKVELHAYLTAEALALGLAPFELALSGYRSNGDPATLTVHVPNPFTFLLMKLHAFRDRLGDARKILASHHVLDVYRIVSMMTRAEFDLVRLLRSQRPDADPVLEARKIVADAFGHPDASGALRLRAALSDAGVPGSDAVAQELLSALHALFGTSEGQRAP